MLALPRMARERFGPHRPHQRPRLVEPAFGEARTEQRFHHIAEDVVAVAAAVIARLLAEPDVGGEADFTSDPGAHLAADERVQPLRQLALRAVLVAVEPFGDQQAEHPVPQELQSFVIRVRARAAVGQRFQPQRRVPRLDPEPRQPCARFRRERGLAQIFSPERFQRAAVNHVHGLIHSAEPSVDHSMKYASPTRFSCGTSPIPPPGVAGKRLSAE